MIKPAIILHQDELNSFEVDVIPMKALQNWVQTTHRDDHYMFVVQQSGYFLFELDFNQVELIESAVCFVSPGQVHRYLDFVSSEGWLVFVGTGIIANQSKDIFATYLNLRQTFPLKKEAAIFKLLPVLEDMLQQKEFPLKESLLISLMETITGLVAAGILQSQYPVNLISGQKYRTAVLFKQLVTKEYKNIKQVKTYADLLHITPLYLNEVIKEITGFPASHWINQEIILEAKRLLYYTSLDVKQIAYELGYDDHTYFSRFFRKHTGMTALSFRNLKPSFVQS